MLRFFTLITSLAVGLLAQAQGGVIINEVSNGPSGSQEWIELLVVGDPLSPTAPVDLTDWIIDDNNGEFESGAGTGVATGCLRLSAAFSAMAPGDIIVIYNQSDRDAAIPADDPTDANSDGVFILAGNDAVLQGGNTRPSASDISYLPFVSTGASWSRLLLRNGGDAAQVRAPDGSFYHGFSYGDVTAPFPNFPSGTASFNAGAGGTGSTFALQCGDWESNTAYLRTAAVGRTPGVPNSIANQTLINRVAAGAYDYSNLASAANCTEFCSDGVDNDGDGQADCDDSDCETAPPVLTCQEVTTLLGDAGLRADASISGVINSYAEVTALGAFDVELSSTVGFAAGDRVLLIQMKGATVTQADFATFGNITELSGAGNYEFKRIDNISGTTVIFTEGVGNSYDVTSAVQLVTVPEYNDVTITGTLTATDWDGVTGGILAFDAEGTVTMNASITVNAQGFRGGGISDDFYDGCPGSAGYAYPYPGPLGGEKGEGITTLPSTRSGGRGKAANGGGGGNDVNAGGGGGGNIGQGGLGGREWSGCNQPYGGVGGLSLDPYITTTRIFLGGGGGGGQQNNAGSTPGGDGGGIIFIRAVSIVPNGNSISADGANALNGGGDGGGGGGAGGSILLDIASISASLSVSANGGNGATVSAGHGQGAGAGGGLIWHSGASLPANLTASTIAGLSGSNSAGHGATAGVAGQTRSNLQLPCDAFTFVSPEAMVSSFTDDCAISHLSAEQVYFCCGENGDVTVTGFDQAGNSSTCTSTIYVASTDPLCSDFDRDFVLDYIDLDDDNDGILDIYESGCSQPTFMNFSNLSVATPSVTEVISHIGVDVTFDFEFINEGTEGFEKASNGNFAMGDISAAGDPSDGDSLFISADVPVTYILSNYTNSARGFDTGDQWRLTATGGFVLEDPDGQLNVSIQTGDAIQFSPAVSTTETNGTWRILTANEVTDIHIEANGNPWSPATLSFCLEVDTDGDGFVDRLDIDADGDGCNDVTEAFFTDGDSDGIIGAGPVSVDAQGLVIGTSDGFTVPPGQALFYFQTTVFGAGCGETDCDDGIDNDADGFVDCFDDECSGFAGCGFVSLPDPTCQFAPTPQDFEIQEVWRTTTTMDARQTPVVGDIDGDGIPEVVGKDDNIADGLYIFNGATGALETTITSPRTDTFTDAAAIGDVDNDGFGEIFIISGSQAPAGDDRRLFCYEHDGTLKWKSADQVGYAADDDRMNPMLADFDQDGVPEVLVGNKIYSSVDGALLAQGGTSRREGGHNASSNETFPVAVDILPASQCPTCDGLEIVVGDHILAVDLTQAVAADAITLAVDFSEGLYGIRERGWSSVADMDFDGDLDVVITNRGTSGGPYSNRGLVYIWDGQTDAILGQPYRLDQCSAGTALQGGTANTNTGGHANIADFNGDGTLEIGLAGKSFYVVLDYDSATGVISELWSRPGTDTSERTGSSVFDFEGDGANEVVYRDEDSLYVYNGVDGAIKASIFCTSPTRTEYPVIADVTGNGETNICVTCNSRIAVFSAVSSPWVAARSVWNQHNYFVVNVNDDLTIPQQQQNHAVGLPQGAPVNYPFNGFLTQITQLNTEGQPIYDAQDLAINSISVDGSDCGTLSTLEVTVNLENLGDLDYPAGSNIAFYIGDPNTTAANLVVLESTTAIIAANSTSTQVFDVPSTCFTGDLFAVINDNGTIMPPFTSPGNTYAECDYSNNVSGTSYVCADAFVVTCPGNVSANSSAGDCGRNVTVPAPTSSSACGTVTLVNDFNGTDDASDFYPPGVTTVQWTITDGSGASSTCTQTVTITDVEAPSITCPATQEFPLAGSCTFTVPDYTALATASDNCAATVTQISPVIGASQTGPFTVVLRATDAAGNSDQCSFSVTIAVDTDGDCTSNVLDIDDDNDGIPDLVEVPSEPLADGDGDGVPFYLDDDDTDPGIGNDDGLVESAFDTDGDNVPNHLDLDADNDGIYDAVEAGHGEVNANGRIVGGPADFGTNGLFDGVEDAPDSGTLDQPTADSDSDGNIDAVELDSDNDGCNDVIEAGYLDQNGDGRLGDD